MSKTLALPDDPRSVAFRLVTDALQRDSDLNGAVTTWVIWDGSEIDTQPPDPAKLPWVRVSCRGGPSRWFANRTLATPLLIHIETITEGTEIEDSINLWGCIERVLLSDQLNDALADAKVESLTPRESAFGVEVHQPRWEPVIPNAIYNKADVELKLYRGQGA